MKIQVGNTTAVELSDFLSSVQFQTPTNLAGSFARLLTWMWSRGEIDEASLYSIATGLDPTGITIVFSETPPRSSGAPAGKVPS